MSYFENVVPPDIEVKIAGKYPMGVPRANIEGRVDDKGTAHNPANCWIAASIQLLANDPFIAAFVTHVCCYTGVRRIVKKGVISVDEQGIVVNQAATGEFAVATKDAMILLEAVLMSIWFVNHGKQTDTSKVQDLAVKLFQLTVKSAANSELTGLCFAGFDDAMFTFRPMIIAAMKWWWSDFCSDTYSLHGYRPITTTVFKDTRTNKECSKDTTYNNVVFIDINTVGDWAHLNNEVMFKYFRSAMPIASHNVAASVRDAGISAQHCTGAMYIESLPLRFSVHIGRLEMRTERNASGKAVPVFTNEFMQTPVYYNPRLLILGPTRESGLYAKYRLVGRIAHNGAKSGGHYTSNILHPKHHNEPYDESVVHTQPEGMLYYNWDDKERMTTRTLADKKQTHDETTGLFADKFGVLLEFEKYSG